MENSSGVRVITLKELWEIFIQRWWVMLLAAIICAGGFFAVNQLTFVPCYQSTATLYILKQNESESNMSSDDFSLALKVVNDCDYLLKSHSVLDQVIEQLNLDISYEDLSKAVSTSNPEDTRILEVSVEAASPEEAKQIVDAVCEVGTENITDAMGFQQVNLYEYGTMDTNPSNQMRKLTYAIIGAVAAVLTYTVLLVLYLVDDTLRTDEDIQQYLGLTILGDIPNADGSGKRHYGYSGYRHEYGSGQRESQQQKGENEVGKRRIKTPGK